MRCDYIYTRLNAHNLLTVIIAWLTLATRIWNAIIAYLLILSTFTKVPPAIQL